MHTGGMYRKKVSKTQKFFCRHFKDVFIHLQFDYNRLGPRKNPANCSLELKKVPIAQNTITNLNNHFSKFGKIINIQVSELKLTLKMSKIKKLPTFLFELYKD